MTDASLRVPDLPHLSRELGSLQFPLQRTAPLDTDPTFVIAGDHARVTGGQARGVDEAWGSGVSLLYRLRVEGAHAVTATLTPLGLERDLELGAGGLVERIAVPRAGPVCFFEWVPGGPLSLALTWRIQAPIPPAGDAPRDRPGGESGEGGEGGPQPAVRWRVTERGVVVELQADRAFYLFSHAPAELVVVPDEAPGRRPGLEVRALLESSGGEAVRLAAAGIAAGDDEARALRVLGRSHVVVPTRRAEATRIIDERLAVEASDAALGDALAWAKVRLDEARSSAGVPGPVSDRAVRLALASLASGDPTSARSLSGEPFPADAEDPADGDPADAARRLLVAARYLAWTGDLVTVKHAWKALRTGAEACLRAAAAGDVDSEVVTGALREMVVVAEESGDTELAGRLRSAVAPGGRVEVARPPTAADPAAPQDRLLRAAALIEAVVHGLLGAEPDAPRGRLVLRPRLPGSWTRFHVRKLAVGGAVISMEYDRSGVTHRFTLRQEHGAAPLRVILEPELEGRRVVAARVDGRPAELDMGIADGRLRVPVQLVLDHDRRLELEILGADA